MRSPAVASARPASRGPRRLDRRARGASRVGGLKRQLGCRRGLAPGEPHDRPGTLRHRRRHGQPQLLRRAFGACGDRLGAVDVPAAELDAGHRLRVIDHPARGDPGELPTAGTAHEILDPGGRLAHLSARHRKAHAGHRGYVAVSRALYQSPLGRTPGAVEVAFRHAHMRGVRQHPAHDVVICGDLRRLKRIVLKCGRRRQVPAPHRAQRLRAEGEREELRLTGGARYGGAASGVADRVIVAFDQELRHRQAVHRVEVPRAPRRGPRPVHHRLVDAGSGLDDGSGVRAGVGQRGGGGADEHGILERSGRGECPPAEAARSVDVEREERHRHLCEQGGHRLRRALVRERFECGIEASLRLFVATEEVLGGRAAGGEGHPQPGFARPEPSRSPRAARRRSGRAHRSSAAPARG